MQNSDPFVIKLKNSNEYQPLLSGLPQTCGMRAGRVCLAPNETCGQHSTKKHEETLVFLSGAGKVQFDSHCLDVAVGNICYIPPETQHDVQNTGTEPLSYIYCVAPIAQ